MKVLLLKRVPKFGDKGEVKIVTDGYGRNYLMPQGLATPATVDRVEAVVKEKKQKTERAVKDLVATEKLAERINGQLIEITAKANEEGKLYAAVSPVAIVKELKLKGLDNRKDQIVLPQPLKELGEFTVTISLDHGLEAEITLSIHD